MKTAPWLKSDERNEDSIRRSAPIFAMKWRNLWIYTILKHIDLFWKLGPVQGLNRLAGVCFVNLGLWNKDNRSTWNKKKQILHI